ncbi:MAG: hypothetical protein CMJ58_00370 [Planctomycetaceae bacterium]|nr:hypothetical protein [Planctomycetaceae bacterium]
MLNKTNETIAEILATRVRVMTARQLARCFYADRQRPVECARRSARRLRTTGFAETFAAAAAELPAARPLAVCTPGDPPPPLAQLAWQNERRWQAAWPIRQTCLVATPQAAAEFGGRRRPPRRRELEHDLQVANVYLALRAQGPELVAGWTHEDFLPYGQSDRPDALLRTRNDTTVIEVLGRGYGRDRIAAVWRAHRHQTLQLY